MKEFVFRKNQGFTLIEMIVVIAIVGILASVTFVSLSGARIDKELKAAANELASVVREQRNNALSGNVPMGTLTCEVRASADSYDITCPTLITRPLPSGISFESAKVLGFLVPFGQTSPDSLRLQKGGKSILVCVVGGKSGTNVYQDIQVTDVDAATCP